MPLTLPYTGTDLTAEVNRLTTHAGWANYSDTQYTSGAPFSLAANTPTILPNNAGSKLETYLPTNRATFYDGTVLVGNNGDARSFTINCQVVPTSAAATYIEFWVDIGGAVGELYRRILTFPKGQGVIRPVTLSTSVYTLDTWETNGGTVYCQSNGTADIYDIRFVVFQHFGA